jgi:hypothetical protein
MSTPFRKIPALIALIALTVPTVEARGQVPVGRWLGQDGHDLVGGNPGPSKNDYQDIHIALKGLPTNREVAEVVIRGFGSGEWKTSNKDQFTVLVVRQPRSTSADLYIEPYMREVGRSFDIHVKLDNGQVATFSIPGGKADPNLRAPGSGVEVKWIGQDGHDRTGSGASVGPDGFEDVRLSLAKLSAKAEIKAVEVTGPGNLAWHAGLNPKGIASAEFVRQADDKSRADLYFSPSRDLAGQTLKVVVTYVDDRGDVASVVAGKCNPTKGSTKVPSPSPVNSSATARWLGQDGIETAPGDVHVAIDGLSASRQVVAAALSDGVFATWVFRPNDKTRFEAGPASDRLNVRRAGPNKLDLAFPPIRDESGATMTLRLLDQSGREEILRFPGGKCDPGRRAPAPPAGTVTARPGDDLNGLASRFGTINLSNGVYPLTKPLVLTRPVRIVGEAGATLRFAQGGDQPPWTAAIKIHAGGTTLEGFSVRFEGPCRWDREVSFGPSVIGTTDDRDRVPQDPKFGITLARLDLQGPAASSPWEMAVHLIRVVSASSGRIEKNTLKGGSVVFAGGPWTIAENSSRGTLPNTFSFELFTGRYTHDLVLVGNRFRDEGPSGKTWRFLVLTQRGANDLIKDNVAEGGIGPREDDPHRHENTPEVMLTEAYRLHFEGKPAAISTDGRVLVIPPPQGGPASTGDAVAILSGPQAGQWRTIAQPLGPQAYLLDEPIARETDAVSIATGFVRETFESNLVDCRGSGIAADLVLAGNQFGVKVLRNRLLGGATAIRLLASPTEEPIHWGWSHAPFLGALFEGNTLEDAPGGGLGVEHGPAVKSTKGRVYMSLTFKDNVLRWARASGPSGKPPRLEIGFAPSLDPKELVITEEGTKVEGAPPQSAWVHAATINGKVVKDSPLTARGSVGARGGNGPASNRRD